MARRKAKKSRKKAGRRSSGGPPRGLILLALAIVAAVAMLAVLIWFNRPGDDTIVRPLDTNVEGRTRGDMDAPVTIIEYADYQCPVCARFAKGTGREIEDEYISAGLVKLEMRNMAFIGNESRLAAKAAECANDQEMFWDYHDKLFEEQRGENQGNYAPDRLKRFAGEIELDQEEFDACLDGDDHEQSITDEVEDARDAGVESTPWFIVVVSGETSGETVQGDRPEELKQAIDTKLAEAELAKEGDDPS